MAVFTGQAYLSAMPGPAAARPTYMLTLQAAPGRDGVRSLRALLKTAGRRYGLRVLSIRTLPPSPPRNSRPTTGNSEGTKQPPSRKGRRAN
jgi:hypothetical protein